MTLESLEKKYACLEKQYRKLFQAIECSPASVIITDRAGRIEYVNPKFTQITGYTLAEVKGENPRLLKSGKTAPKVFKDLWETIKSGKEWHGEFINRKKNGDLYIEEASISPVKDASGIITHFVAVKENITARKQAEKELEKAHAFLQSVIDTVPEPIMVIGTDYRIRLMNRILRQNSHNQPEQEGEAFCYQVSHHNDKPCKGNEHPCPLEEVRKKEEPITVEHIHYTPQGEARYIEIIAAPLWAEDGSFDGIIESSRDVTERKLIEQNLRHLAHFDNLTGLPNRQLFYDRLHQALSLSKRENKLFAILFVDLDGFKTINDTFGHAAGDALLQEVACRLTATLRESDTVARMGGDEFTVILNNISDEKVPDRIIDKISKNITAPYFIAGQQCSVGASIGVSVYPTDGQSADSLLTRADEMMYSRKQQK